MQNMIDDKDLKEDNTRELDEERLSTLLKGASLLRKSLTEDIGGKLTEGLTNFVLKDGIFY
jgi:hypothetical protein